MLAWSKQQLATPPCGLEAAAPPFLISPFLCLLRAVSLTELNPSLSVGGSSGGCGGLARRAELLAQGVQLAAAAALSRREKIRSSLLPCIGRRRGRARSPAGGHSASCLVAERRAFVPDFTRPTPASPRPPAGLDEQPKEATGPSVLPWPFSPLPSPAFGPPPPTPHPLPSKPGLPFFRQVERRFPFPPSRTRQTAAELACNLTPPRPSPALATMDTKDYEKDGHSGEADFSKEYSPEGREPHINPVRDTDEYEAHLELETTHRGLKAR